MLNQKRDGSPLTSCSGGLNIRDAGVVVRGSSGDARDEGWGGIFGDSSLCGGGDDDRGSGSGGMPPDMRRCGEGDLTSGGGSAVPLLRRPDSAPAVITPLLGRLRCAPDSEPLGGRLLGGGNPRGVRLRAPKLRGVSWGVAPGVNPSPAGVTPVALTN